MIKKTISAGLATLLLFVSFSSVNASFSFEDADTEDTNTTQTEETATTDVSIANMDIVFNDESIPADGESETVIYVKVNNDNDESLSEQDVDLEVSVVEDNGSIEKIEYKNATELFEVTYKAGKEAGTVSFKIKAFQKSDPTNKLEQLEDFTLTPYEEPVEEEIITETEEPTDSNDNVEDILTGLENSETTTEEEETKDTTANNGINIIGSKIIDENRLKVTFDRKIFLPDDPLSLITIEKVSDKKNVPIANITLSEDEMSLIVLTSENIEKVPYLVTITEVIDGETKKKVSVVNSELTVTGISDLVFIFIGLISGIAMLARRKSKKNV